MSYTCLNCGNKFYIKRSILDLFSTKKALICKKCMSQSPLNIQFEEILLEKYKVTIVTLFKSVFIKDFSCFYYEYGKIFEALYNSSKSPIIFVNHITLNDDALEELNVISICLNTDIIVLSFTKKSY